MRQVYCVYLLLYSVNQFREYFFVCIRMTRNEKNIHTDSCNNITLSSNDPSLMCKN